MLSMTEMEILRCGVGGEIFRAFESVSFSHPTESKPIEIEGILVDFLVHMNFQWRRRNDDTLRDDDSICEGVRSHCFPS